MLGSGMFGTLVFSTDASAATINNDSTNPDDWLPQIRAQRWAYVTALNACTDNNDQNEWNVPNISWGKDIKEADVASGVWFGTGQTQRTYKPASWIGTSPGEDGKINCNEVVKLVMNTYKIGGLALFCSLGGERADGSDCLESRTGSGFEAKALNRMNVSATWGSALPSNAGGAAYYKLNQAALEKGCNVGGTPVTTSDEFTYDVTKVDDITGNITTVKLRGVERSKTTHMYTTYNRDQLDLSCADIAAEMKKNAKAYADWVMLYKPTEGDIAGANPESGSSDSAPSNCAITGIGWIVCPVSRGVAAFVGAMFNILELFLAVPSLSAETDGPLYSAWSVMRNIANVVFVIVFMLVIYSQMTGGGKR